MFDASVVEVNYMADEDKNLSDESVVFFWLRSN